MSLSEHSTLISSDVEETSFWKRHQFHQTFPLINHHFSGMLPLLHPRLASRCHWAVFLCILIALLTGNVVDARALSSKKAMSSSPMMMMRSSMNPSSKMMMMKNGKGSPSPPPPLQAPAPCTNRPFQSNDELRKAVRDYIANLSEMGSTVALKYGWPIGEWCVGNITDFSYIFDSLPRFNEDISKWNTSSAVTMFGMFAGATYFNSDLSMWDVSNVQFMNDMFNGAASFNSDLSMWDVSNVQEMNYVVRTR